MTTPKRSHPVVVITTNPQSEEPLHLELRVYEPIRRGQQIAAQLVATGGTGGYAFALDSGSLPPGVTGPFNPNGVFAGAPTATGTYVFKCSVQDTSATVAPASFSMTVASRLTERDVNPVIGEIGVPYSYSFRVNNATGAVTWTKTEGTLPAGLTLSPSGVLSGTPTAPHGLSYAKLLATDAGSGDTLQVQIVIEIAEQLHDVAGIPGPGNTGDVFTDVRGSIDLRPKFSGGVPPYRVEQGPPFYVALADFEVSAPSTRAGSITFSGIPKLSGLQYSLPCVVQFKVTDALGMQAFFETEINVYNSKSSIGAQKDGVDVDRSPPTVNFTGSAVTSVVSDDSGTTVTIDQPAPITASGLSVLGRNTSSSGAPVSITAAANDRVLVRAAGALSWAQVTPAMLSFAPVTSVAGTAPIVSSGGATPMISHATSGVTAGTYGRVTVDVNGHVTGGAQDGTTVFGRSISASLQYNASDFAGMSPTTEVVRLTGSAGGTSTFNEFFASPRAGQYVSVVNASTTTITVKHNTAGGTAGSKILCGADFSLLPDHGMTLWRDGTSSAWRVVGGY